MAAFNHALNAVVAEQERMQQRALALHQKVSTPGIPRKEHLEVHEELHAVNDRLQLTQHYLDEVALQSEVRAKAAEGNAADSSASIRPAQALVARDLTECSTNLSIGQQLLTEFRRLVRPTLLEQLGGLDSPFQPPSVISVALERTLRHHMNTVRQEWERDEARLSNFSHEFGRALVELLRALAHEQRLTTPRGGIEGLRERVGTPLPSSTLPRSLSISALS